MNELLTVIKELFSRLDNISPLIWESYKAQARIESICAVTTLVVMYILGFAFINISKKSAQTKVNHYDEWLEFPKKETFMTCGVGIVVISTLFIFNLSNILAGFLNTDYAALKLLLRQLKYVG